MLVAFYDGVPTSADNGRVTDEICLNFCKAFDLAPESILLLNCRDMGSMGGLFDG